VPELGAVDVPPNISTLVWDELNHGPGLAVVSSATGDEVELERIADDVDAGVVGRYRIVGSLLPSTSYSVEFGGDVVPYFTTAAADDTTPPPTPSLADFGINKGMGNDDCTPERLDVRATTSLPEAALLGVRFTTVGRREQTYYVDPARGFASFGGGCRINVDVEVEADVTVAIWTEDIAGNRSEEAVATTRVDSYDGEGGCSSGGTSLGGALGLLALRRRRRC
jgi:hypothetical protein